MAAIKKTAETKRCIVCGHEKPSSGSNNKFYKHWNKYISDDLGFCKQCVEDIGKLNDIKEVHRLLRLMDMPFLPEKWEECTKSDNTLVAYIGSGKGLNNPRATIEGIKISDMRYEDSPMCKQVEDIDKFLISNDTEKLENINKWGEHYSQAEYMKLSASVENNIKVTGRDDYQSLRGFERVARAEIERDRAYANKDFKPNDKKAAEDNVTNMMKQAGLSYDQVSRSASDSVLPEDIKVILENYDPVPVAQGLFADPDGIGSYINRFLTTPLKRAMGKDSSKTKDDFEEIKSDIKSRKKKFEG